MSALEIVRATEADIPFIMATERLPGNEGLVGRWEREEHERALGDPGNAYSSVWPMAQRSALSSFSTGHRLTVQR